MAGITSHPVSPSRSSRDRVVFRFNCYGGGHMKFRSRLPRFLPRILAAVLLSLLLAASAFAGNPVPQVVGPPIPQAVVPGSGAFTLTVYGANFVSGAVVNWNRSPRTTAFISARELQAQILASDVVKS